MNTVSRYGGDTPRQIGVDDAIDNGDVVARLAAPHWVDVGTPPLKIGRTIAARHQVVSEEIDLTRTKLSAFHQQFSPHPAHFWVYAGPALIPTIAGLGA